MALVGDFPQVLFVDSSYRNRSAFPHASDFDVNIATEQKGTSDPVAEGYPIYIDEITSTILENGETIVMLKNGVPITFFENNLLNKFVNIMDPSFNTTAYSKVKGFYKLRTLFTFPLLDLIVNPEVDGSVITINTPLALSSNNIYNGMYLHYTGPIDPSDILFGASDNRYFQIIAYDGVTKKATISPSISYHILTPENFSLMDTNSLIRGLYVDPISVIPNSGYIVIRQISEKPLRTLKYSGTIRTLQIPGGSSNSNAYAGMALLATDSQGTRYSLDVTNYNGASQVMAVSTPYNTGFTGNFNYTLSSQVLFTTFSSYSIINNTTINLVGGAPVTGIYNGMFIKSLYGNLFEITNYVQVGADWQATVTGANLSVSSLITNIYQFVPTYSFTGSFLNGGTFDEYRNIYIPNGTTDLIGAQFQILEITKANTSPHRLIAFDPFTSVGTFDIPFSGITFGYGKIGELYRYNRNNENGLSIIGGAANRGSPCNYTVYMNWIRIPRYPIFVDDVPSMKKTVSDYSYVIVELQNKNGSSSNSIQSNNPNTGKGQFIVPLDDIGTGIGRFITFRPSGSVTLKLNPNDTLHFSVRLPDGNLIKFDTSDEMYSPKLPNETLQISAHFTIKRELYGR